MIKVLVVDDSALMRKVLGQILSAEPDMEVATARDGIEALEQVKAFEPDVVTLDVHMPQMNGLDCLDRIMIERPCPVVMVSSATAEGADATLEAMRLGAVDFVLKPEGTISLSLETLAPELVAKVRAAAGARLKSSLRLKDRVRHRIGTVEARRRAETRAANDAMPLPATGDGIVLVGTSTGGPPALEALLVPLPDGFPWPIVVAQHMPASFTGSLARRLDALCALTVTEVQRPVPVTPGNVYIARGDADLVISRRPGGPIAMAVPSQSGYPWHPSVDRLVRSAMEQIPPSQLIGVLMTGMGHDGAEAMALLRERGGRTIAEAEETAIVWGMPGELVKAGGADLIVPLPEIAERLQELIAPQCP